MTMIDLPLAELRSQGFCVVRNAVDADVVAALNADLDAAFADAPFCDGDFYGRSTKRLGGMLKRSAFAEAFVRHPLALGLADAVLGPWCDRFGLNLTQAIEIHGGAPAQYPHRDEDMWAGPKGELDYLINVMWPLTPFVRENGATRLWPGSHMAGSVAGDEALATVPELMPGDVLVFLGSTLHGGGGNARSAARRGLVVSYCLGWLKPFENQWLVYPPEVARSFDPELAALVGYAQHRPNLGNVEGRCPTELLYGVGGDGDGIGHGGLPPADALLPEQTAALGDWVTEGGAAAAHVSRR
ncbi:MAG: phytanoyl-CoA dioxygenase [Sphingopyxis macrogoltabida]|uniref:Phytanoyl-CoA dioxygenase n=1 Tax=Sphingopyxis macrogoltabida TaxID=33050 RepID=A0A2W5KZ85_SPHMC|nr:MAG: phytanoyl-CoA dioxygenase [Sphingopyxis macrogoltabida]